MSRLERVGVVLLIKKRDAPSSSHAGIKICEVLDSGSADFSLPSRIVWRNDLEALLGGFVRFAPVYLGNLLPLRKNPIAGGDVHE